MTRLPQLGAAIACAGLSLVIALDLLSSAMLEEAGPTDLLQSAPPRNETIVLAADTKALVATILERPLFSPTRAAPQRKSDPLFEEISPGPPRLQARLAGVMIRPGVREALFIGADKKPAAVTVGGEIDGWRIVVISPDGVILSSPFGNQMVKPTNGPETVRPRGSSVVTDRNKNPAANSTKPAAVTSIATAVVTPPPLQSPW
jgi:hypothetical protein